MKNISLNFESLNSPDGGISRVANLVLKFFKERSKLTNDKLFLNIFRDNNIQKFKWYKYENNKKGFKKRI